MSSLPIDWKIKPIGEISRVVNGGTPKTKVEDYWGGNHCWITPAEMGKRSEPFVSETKRTLTDSGLQGSSASIVPPFSVILSTRAPIGHLVINTEPMAFNQGCRGLVPLEELDYKYLYYFLMNSIGLLNDLGTGATFKELSSGKLKGVQVPVPPLPEQKRIVAILDEAFVGISLAVANAEKNLTNARELFESYLNNVFTQKGDGWEETCLEEILEVQPRNGWSPPAANHSDTGTPVLTLSSVTGFIFKPVKVKFTSADVDAQRHYWVNNGDLLISRSNTPELVGHVAIASGLENPTIYPDLIMRMNPDPEKALTKFLYYQLRTPTLRTEITGRAQGANPTMKKINKSAVQTLPIRYPSITAQKKIISQLDDLVMKTNRLEAICLQKFDALAELKQSILQKAFAGELTVDVVQEAIN